MLKLKNIILVCIIAVLYSGVAEAGGAGWMTSVKKAMAESKKTGKPVLADFTGSDWCPPCMAQNKEIFSNQKFLNWAKSNVVLLMLDFPRSKSISPAIKKQNAMMAKKYGLRSYPTVILMGVDGKEIQRKGGYRRGTKPAAWIATIEKNVKKYKSTHAVSAKSSGPRMVSYPAIVKKQLYATNDLRGKQAPDLVFGEWLTKQPELSGQKKVILVDFWATWCGPCVRLIPEMNHFKKRFGKDLQVIGVSDETVAKVKGFMKKTKVNYAMSVDSSGKMKKELGVSGIPHVMVISSDGIVRWQGFPGGSDKLTGKVLKQIIEG